MSFSTDRLERGHLDSEDSLLDEDHSVEMQNPLSVAPESILVNFNNNTANNPAPGVFSDDESSSPESNESPSRNNLSFAPSGDGGSDHDSSKDDGDNGLDESSECGSMAATMRHQRAATSLKGEDEEDSAEELPPAAVKGADMEDVDLGSTNRIMALRKTNDSSSTKNQNPERRESGHKDEARTVMDPSTAEPSPNTIVPGDASGDELSEVSSDFSVTVVMHVWTITSDDSTSPCCLHDGTLHVHAWRFLLLVVGLH